jgi:hypothetical protein
MTESCYETYYDQVHVSRLVVTDTLIAQTRALLIPRLTRDHIMPLNFDHFSSLHGNFGLLLLSSRRPESQT